MRVSNGAVGILNVFLFLLSVPILIGGIWLRNQGTTECERFLETPVIVLGVLLMLVSLAGLAGSCCRVSLLLWIYLLAMFVLILVLFCFTIFAFVVTHKGAGEALSGKGYKEYRFGDYSNWLQKRVNSTENWSRIKSCLQDSKICRSMIEQSLNGTVDEFYREHLSSLQSGCCKPSDSCNFEYVSPTVWRISANSTTANPDCAQWGNDPSVLCFDCQSCKAGLLDNVKNNWKKVAIVNIVFLIGLIAVYSVGCCALRNNKEDNIYLATRPYYPKA